MSIQTELTRITNAKAAIKAAIEGKGVTVPDATLLDGMAALIESIQAGGGGGGGLKVSTGTYTSAANTAYITVQHTLGVIPTFAFVYVLDVGSTNGLFMLFQNESIVNISHAYGSALVHGTPLTSAGLTESKLYNIRAYGANESDISFGVNTTAYTLFPSGKTYQWTVGVTE